MKLFSTDDKVEVKKMFAVLKNEGNDIHNRKVNFRIGPELGSELFEGEVDTRQCCGSRSARIRNFLEDPDP
jgi:hypothetical protein